MLNQQAESQLLVKVMSRLDRERRLRFLRRRLLLTVFSFGPLLLLAIPVWRNFWLDFQKAGLVDYLSLLVSDAKIVLANWQNFSLGFLESFPVVSLVSVLGTIMAWLLVIKLICQYGQEFLIMRNWPEQRN